MQTYQLTPEEVAALDAKYGPALSNREQKLSCERYMEMKLAGVTDEEICRNIHIHWTTLSDLKRKWMIGRVLKGGRKAKTKGLCKLCEKQEFVRGLCKQHYYKQWRWNHAN